MLKMKLTKKKVVLISLAVLILSGAYLFISNKNKPVEVSVDKAEIRDIVKTISISGTIEAENQVDLAFSTSGKINSINVKEEDLVKANDILAYLDSSSLYNNYLANKALYDKAVQALETFKETYKDDPATALVNSDDIYWSKYYEYQDAIDSAKATTDASLNSLSNAYIKSPIDGTVTKVTYKEGEYITMGATVVQVSDLNSIYFVVEVSQEDLGQIKLGQKVNIELDTYPDIKINGEIFYISQIPTKDSSANNVYEVKIKFINNSLPTINLGMEGNANIIIENKIKRLSVDSSSILEVKDDKFVYKVANNKLEKVMVRTGFEGDIYIEIEEGLNSGESIVLSPSFKLSPGKSVKVK